MMDDAVVVVGGEGQLTAREFTLTAVASVLAHVSGLFYLVDQGVSRVGGGQTAGVAGGSQL